MSYFARMAWTGSEVWPKHPSGRGRFWCRRCDKSGDAVDYVQARDQVGFREALDPCGLTGARRPPRQRGERSRRRSRPAVPDVAPPSAGWQERARAFVGYARERLWSEGRGVALMYLMAERGLREETIRQWGLGYNPEALYDRGVARWGVDGKAVYLSPGIVIPVRDRRHAMVRADPAALRAGSRRGCPGPRPGVSVSFCARAQVFRGQGRRRPGAVWRRWPAGQASAALL